jgi:hypothetical protein
MKLQGTLKNLKKLRRQQNKDLDELISTLTNNYFTDIVKYQEDLLLNICREKELDYDELHSKYIKTLKKTMKKSKNANLIDNSDSESEIENDEVKASMSSNEANNDHVLEKIKIDSKVCYIENKEGGSIFNNEVIKIGEVKDGEYHLYT